MANFASASAEGPCGRSGQRGRPWLPTPVRTGPAGSRAPRRLYDGVIVTTSRTIIDSALKLPREERARVAREIIASLDGPADQDVDAAWLAEVERRLDDVERGAAALVPWDTVRQRVTERLRAVRR